MSVQTIFDDALGEPCLPHFRRLLTQVLEYEGFIAQFTCEAGRLSSGISHVLQAKRIEREEESKWGSSSRRQAGDRRRTVSICMARRLSVSLSAGSFFSGLHETDSSSLSLWSIRPL
ncbi:unnamed protein product [Pleuronectes platessa]|uniref:Uncharacterized protein n=1 Tax=Pleuronectes platessa TaxID=8262 RepID=A0A9N7US20_PLEPL|nr:unnamed protein product [Pleuronectes platessa]